MRVIVSPSKTRKEQAREWARIATDGDVSAENATAAALTSIALSLSVLTEHITEEK